MHKQQSVKKGFLTFPTKFEMVDDILNINYMGKVIVRMSVNPDEIINKVEFGTSRLKERIEAINKLVEAGYKVGILIAPVIMLDNWKIIYLELIKELSEKLTLKVKKDVFFEIIFMTYSYVHTKINEEAFPETINVFNKNLMTGRGRGKYMYKNEYRKDGEKFFIETLKKYFPNTEIKYIYQEKNFDIDLGIYDDLQNIIFSNNFSSFFCFLCFGFYVLLFLFDLQFCILYV